VIERSGDRVIAEGSQRDRKAIATRSQRDRGRIGSRLPSCSAKQRSAAQHEAPGFLLVGVVAAILLFAASGRGAPPSRLAGELDARGLEQRIAAEKGKAVLVNFWATWCVPCREEFPDLARLQKAYGGRVQVIGISTDFTSQLAQVEKFLAEHKPNFPNYRKKSGGDDQAFIEFVDPSWGGELPFSVVYSPDGRKARVLSGKQNYGSFEKEVKAALKRT
jgi:thiol-disulfide isomerase/thioredoxin